MPASRSAVRVLFPPGRLRSVSGLCSVPVRAACDLRGSCGHLSYKRCAQGGFRGFGDPLHHLAFTERPIRVPSRRGAQTFGGHERHLGFDPGTGWWDARSPRTCRFYC